MIDANQEETAAVVIEDPIISTETEIVLEENISLTDIIVELTAGKLIKLKKANDGRASNIVTDGKSVRLAANRTYYIPITNKKLRKNDMNIIRAESEIGEQMLLLNVENGFVCIYPLFNNLLIKNNIKLGVCI
jgi:hypothetical protein